MYICQETPEKLATYALTGGFQEYTEERAKAAFAFGYLDEMAKSPESYTSEQFAAVISAFNESIYHS